jgi:hypothetical protein
VTGYVYKPPAFIAGLVRRKQAQHKNMLIIMAATYVIALLIGAYAIFTPADKTGVFYAAIGNGPEYGSFSQAPGMPPNAGGLTERRTVSAVTSTNLLRTNPTIVRDETTAPACIEIATLDAGDFGWANEIDLMPGVPGGSDLVFASDSYGDNMPAGGDTSLPGRAMWEWTERTARIIIPPDTTPAHMKPTTQLRHPRKAVGIDGWVVLRFKISERGLYDLEILVEDPPGLGFGAAVQTYFDNCYVWPATVGGRPVVTDVRATFRVCIGCATEAKTSGNLVFHQQ